jgi:Spy/CpxP family protein refolding chaperone
MENPINVKVQPIALILGLILFALVLGLIAYSAYAFNIGSGDHRGFSRTSNKPRENKSLNLTLEQEGQLRNLRDKEGRLSITTPTRLAAITTFSSSERRSAAGI